MPSFYIHIVLDSIGLPLESQQLDLKEIRDIGTIGNRPSFTEVTINRSDDLFLNHPEPVFSTSQLTTCPLDE